jgi:hypothetical protein
MKRGSVSLSWDCARRWVDGSEGRGRKVRCWIVVKAEGAVDFDFEGNGAAGIESCR